MSASPPDGCAAAERYLAEHEDKLAWIMGSSRSGSTWLLRMLTGDPRVVGIDDPHIGHHLGIWRPLPLAWATARQRPELGTLFALKRGQAGYFFSDHYRDAWLPPLRKLIRTRFAAQLAEEAAGADVPRLVVKEPGSHVADLLLEAFPRSRLIFLLRDGRDVVDSWLDAYRDGSWAIEEGAFAVAPQGRLPLIEWLSSVWAFRTRCVADAYARHHPDRRLMIRYENLLEDPTAELARVFAGLGFEVDLDRLRRTVDEHAYERVSSASRGPRREIRAASPGAWRRNLTRAEQRAMHEVMGEELEAQGYLAAPIAARAA